MITYSEKEKRDEWIERGFQPMDFVIADTISAKAKNNQDIWVRTLCLSAALRNGNTICPHKEITEMTGIPHAQLATAGSLAKKFPEVISSSKNDKITPLKYNRSSLAFHRADCNEARLASAAIQLAATEKPRVHFDQRLEKGADESQINALEQAYNHKLTIITGGPGSGKTSTVVRLLSALKDCGEAHNIAIIAPTGKAVARLWQSIESSWDQLNDRPLPEVEKATVHRLLGAVPGKASFKYGLEHKLPHDTFIIDEASMLDSGMATALLEAIKPGSHITILGDKDQLASVDAGSFLAEMIKSSEFSPIASAELKGSHRFSEQSPIKGFADWMLKKKRSLPQNAEGLNIIPLSKNTISNIGNSVANCLENNKSFCVLTPTNKGIYGAEQLNESLEKFIKGIGEYQTPIIISKNDYTNELFNGDCGALSIDGKTLSFFDGDKVREVNAAFVPDWKASYAMTIHKAQGSEFDEVIIILPAESDKPILRELLYTAATRAKKKLTIIADKKLLNEIRDSRQERYSSLSDKIKQQLK